MKQSKLFLGIMIVVAVISGVVTLTYLQSTNRYLADANALGAKVAGVSTARQSVTMVINDGQQTKTYRQAVNESMNLTGYDLLRRAVTAAEWNLKSSTGSMGTFVEEINGAKNGTDGKYWIYYVNNQMGTVGISQYQIQAGDLLQMNFETSAL
jgi:hypothetical protein